MNRKLISRCLLLLLAAATLAGLYAMGGFLDANRVRGDEFLSFLHSDPLTHHWSKIPGNIRNGSDNSYTHALLLNLAFRTFGTGIVTQRALSFFFWLAGGALLWLVMSEQPGNRLQRYLFWFLAQFGNMGFMLANDGRFYSMHYACALLVFYCLLKSIRSGAGWLPALAVAVLCSLLTTSLGVVSIGVIMVSLLVAAAGRHISWQRYGLAAAAVAGSCLVYFLFFRIGSFQSYFMRALFSGNGTESSFAVLTGTGFRFVAMAHLPGLPDAAGVAFSAVLLGWLLWYSRKSVPEQTGVTGVVINNAMGLLLGLLVVQAATHVLFGWMLWPFRYYAGLSWIAALWLHRHSNILLNARTSIAALVICAGISLRMVNETQKIALRNSQRAEVQGQGPFVFIETGEKYGTFAAMGEWYIRQPALRPQLFLGTDSLSLERNAYFRLLQSHGDDLQLADPSRLAPGCTLVVSDSSEYKSWKTRHASVLLIGRQ